MINFACIFTFIMIEIMWMKTIASYDTWSTYIITQLYVSRVMNNTLYIILYFTLIASKVFRFKIIKSEHSSREGFIMHNK